jgi:hypothetical protein
VLRDAAFHRLEYWPANKVIHYLHKMSNQGQTHFVTDSAYVGTLLNIYQMVFAKLKGRMKQHESRDCLRAVQRHSSGNRGRYAVAP